MRQRVMIAIALACEPRLLIMDEATRSLDVTTQAEVMTLVSLLQSRNEMAIVMVSHDLRLVSRFADDVLVTRDGRTVERAPPHTLISAPRMPYTKALLDAVPSLEAPGRRSDAVGRRSCEAHGDLVLAHSRPEVFGPKPATAPAPRPSSGATGLVAMHAAKRKSPSSAVSASIRADTPLLEVRNLTHEFPVRGPGLHGRSAQRVVSNVSFELRPAETMGLAGESGSGKSTLARAIVQLPRPTSGSVVFNDCELTQLRGGELRQARRRIQMVFQEPLASLDPKWRVSDIVEEPLLGYGVRSSSERRNRVDAILERVGLPPGIYGGRRPRQLSGGQCQRVAIARALALEPDLLICDEVVSSLDALVQAQILDLLARLRAELGLSCLFISHDLAVLRQLSDRIAVLHSGQLCEIGATESLYRTPAHPYTSVLLASATIHKGDVAARGSPARASTICPPSPGPQHGCRFRDNCRSAQPKCAVEQPSLKKIGADHWVACHFPMTTEAEPKLTASGGRR
jgi:oligopeptide/dipeptide ABC transporter ATP-binding protein